MSFLTIVNKSFETFILSSFSMFRITLNQNPVTDQNSKWRIQYDGWNIENCIVWELKKFYCILCKIYVRKCF